MKLIIDIDEDTYKSVIADSTTYVLDEILVENAIYNGIPLEQKDVGRMCLYDEAFTQKEMLEETERCQKCKIEDCPNCGARMESEE